MTKTTKSATALSFHDQKFDIIDRNGQQWLRVSQIGRALYGKGLPQTDAPFAEKHLRKLYERHAAEFTTSMTAVVKLKTPGGMQDVRIFSLRGAHLLGMFARTERAAEFRRWVLDILDAQTAAEAQRRAKPGATALTAPHALADIDVRALMLADNSTPTVPLPAEVQGAINRKAWAMAHDAYELCREHLARRVAYRCEYSYPERLLDKGAALAMIAETTLDMALTPAHYNQLAMMLRVAEGMARSAAENHAALAAELGKLHAKGPKE